MMARRHAGAVHRLLERRQPAAGPRHGAAARARHARRPGRRPRPHRPAAAHRRRRARARQRAARRRCWPSSARASSRRRFHPATFPYYIQLARGRPVARLSDRRRRLDRARLRPRSRAADDAPRAAGEPEGRRPRQRPAAARWCETRWSSRRCRWRSWRWSARCSSCAASAISTASELGFDTTSPLTLRFFMSGERYAAEWGQGFAASKTSSAASRRCLACRPCSRPTSFPISGGGGGAEIDVEGRGDENQRATIQFPAVTPHVLPNARRARAAGARLHRGGLDPIGRRSSTRRWPDACGRDESPIDRRFRLVDPGRLARVAHRHRRRARLQLCGIDPSNSQVPAAAFAPYRVRRVVNTGLTIRVAGDPAAITSRPSARRFAPRIRTCRCSTCGRSKTCAGSSSGSSACTAGFSARIGVVGVAARVDRRLRRAGLLGLAAHAGDRRARRARRRPAACLQADRRAGSRADRRSASSSVWRWRRSARRWRAACSTT